MSAYNKRANGEFRERGAALNEAAWMMVCLSLFLLLGPFSAPFALFAVLHHGWTQHPPREPEFLLPGENL